MIQIKKYNQSILSIFIYIGCYIFINHRGPLIDNDTIEYIGFAQTIAAGEFPFSPYYQPGLGLLIYIFKNIFFTDYLTAFRIVNFTAGLGLVLTLQKLWRKAFGDHKFIPVILAGIPAVIYLSSLLYADIVFDFLAFTAILFLVNSYKDKFDYSTLFTSSFLTTLAIFTKYNALVVLVLGVVFIMYNSVLNKHLLSLLFKKLLVFSLLPVSYVVFWKIFNGSLAMVEFNRWIEPVTMDCIVRFLKLNWISLYHLLLDRGLLGLELYINHIVLFIFGFILMIYLFKKANLTFAKIAGYIRKNLPLTVLLLFVALYTFAVTTMESLNCKTEPCVRLYSGTFIGFGFLLMGLLYKLSCKILTRYQFFIYILFSVYNVFVLYRIYNDTRGVFIDGADKSHMAVINFLKEHKKYGEVAGFATPKINRYWFALGGEFKAMGVFPYQHYHNSGHDYYFDDSTYLKMIAELAESLKTNQFLIIKTENINLIKKIPFDSSGLNLVFSKDEIFVLKKS